MRVEAASFSQLKQVEGIPSVVVRAPRLSFLCLVRPSDWLVTVVAGVWTVDCYGSVEVYARLVLVLGWVAMSACEP